MSAPRAISVRTFEDFRGAARALLGAGAAPAEVEWLDARERQTALFGAGATPAHSLQAPDASPLRVSRAFLERAERVSMHRDPDRWALLYRLLWRLQREQPRLLELPSDPDVRRFELLDRAVRTDEHRMHAFVRFRRVLDDASGEEVYVAWHAPDHPILRLAAPFFARRFASMRWSILTPDESAHWDGALLHFGEGTSRADAPSDDALESLWRTYYASVFNPARLNLSAMRRDMPSRFWSALPELSQVASLVGAAPGRTARMLSTDAAGAAQTFLPSPEDRSLESLSRALRGCTACPLHERATQAVFGEGPVTARAMLVGEQPGDLEDVEGRPFVGPAGMLLDEALAQAGLDRSSLYLTNAVKHFRWVPSDRPGDKRRIHERPGRGELRACRPWLDAEVAAIKPGFVVCLGATAAQAVLGTGFRLAHSRGQVFSLPEVPWVLATWHPAAVLRARDEDARAQLRAELVEDLRLLSTALVSGSARG